MFKHNRKITIIVMTVTVGILIFWDIVALLTGDNHDTESHIILETGAQNFTLPFAMSGLLGHWFWPREEPPFGLSKGIAFVGVLMPVMLLLGTLDVFYTTPEWMLPLIAPVGYVFGSLFWPQKKPRSH